MLTAKRTTKKRLGTALAVAFSLGLITGCGAISDLPSVSTDKDGGSVTIKGKDGESATLDMDSSGELPDWFPDGLPLPDDFTVVTSSEFETNEGYMKSVALTTHQDFDSLIAQIDDGLAAAGITPEPRSVSEQAGMQSALFGAELESEGWMINILDYGDDEEGIGITYATVHEE